MPAPSPMTKPSRSLSNGRLARVGSSLRVERARALPKPARAMGLIVASVPPVTMTSASPARSRRSDSPMACAPDAHAEVVEKLGPRRPNWMDTCPGAMSRIIIGMKNGLTRPGPFSISCEC